VDNQPNEKERRRRSKAAHSRIPEGSVFFDKVVPALLIVMAVIMILLIGAAVAVLLGLVPYR
jgi:hypothetical protein